MTDSADLPLLRCYRVQKPLALSGRLDDPQWACAESVMLVDAVTGKPGRYSTRVRALYSDSLLYIGFECEDVLVWGTITERDGPIWEEECVEVFVNPAAIAHQYYEINVSPRNTVFDACVLNRRTPDRPNESFLALTDFSIQGLVTATHVDGELGVPMGAQHWTAEYAIPLRELIGAPHIPPQPGDLWRINFYRIDSPEPGRRESYAWSPTFNSAFHRPWRFGYLRFESKCAIAGK